MIKVMDQGEGCVLFVRAQPGAKRNALVGERAGALKVAITAPPENNRANQALLEFLAKSLGLKRSQLDLSAGHASRDKKILIRGKSAQELLNLLGDV